MFIHKKHSLSICLFSCALYCAFVFSSCQTIDLYEKNVAIPQQEWKSDFRPQFNFTIKDSLATYDIFVVLRHNEKYEFNNIWISLTTQRKGDPATTSQYELRLADNERWLGAAMDDLYEHYVPIASGIHLKPGEYSFVIAQIMRQDPLENVMNVGLRIEKNPQ